MSDPSISSQLHDDYPNSDGSDNDEYWAPFWAYGDQYYPVDWEMKHAEEQQKRYLKDLEKHGDCWRNLYKDPVKVLLEERKLVNVDQEEKWLQLEKKRSFEYYLKELPDKHIAANTIRNAWLSEKFQKKLEQKRKKKDLLKRKEKNKRKPFTFFTNSPNFARAANTIRNTWLKYKNV